MKKLLLLILILIPSICIAEDKGFLVLTQQAKIIKCHTPKANNVCFTVGNYRWEEQSSFKYKIGDYTTANLIFQPITTTANEDEQEQRVFRLLKIILAPKDKI